MHCNSVRNLRPPHAPVTGNCPVSLTRCSVAPREKKSKRYPAVYRRTHRQTDTYPPCGDRGGCNNGFAPSNHMIPEMYVTFPQPYPSPASWTLLSPLSIQDSRNISSNDRYHYRLSSLDNNKTGIYLSIYL